ncbi:MAG TPA: hypothetical protein VFG47_08015, partial [Geminicoccaceae bacterium]|nr:hypothetical protein [Geminicoccaceae bacterium]
QAERLHRGLTAGALAGRRSADLAACRAGFERWRRIDNEERPHEAPGPAVPLSRYSPSPRPYPERQPPIEYAPDDAPWCGGSAGGIFRLGLHRLRHLLARGRPWGAAYGWRPSRGRTHRPAS